VFVLLRKFDYICPNNIQEVFLALNQAQSRHVLLLAGGTDLIPALRSKDKHADCLIDLRGLDLDYVKCFDKEIRIGSLTTFRTLIRNTVIRSELPILVNASSKVGAVQTQSLATVGGNLCSGLPSADSATSLMVLNAKLRLVSKGQERIVEVKDFFVGPGKTTLQCNEILAEIIIPIVQNRRACFLKIGRRKAMSLSIINCATSLRIDRNGTIEEARIALGAVATTPMLAIEAEKLITGEKPSVELFKQAGKIAAGEINPRSSIRASAEYRRLLAEMMVKRNLEDTLQQF